MRSSIIASIVVSVLVLIPASASPGPIIEQGLEAFLPFEEGSGSTTQDLTGNGHDGQLISASWGSGFITIASESALIQVIAGPELRANTFTYDLWFEAHSTSGHGRFLGQAENVGGTGPDILERAGRTLAIRINNTGAVFQVPTIGTRSNSGPPDHWGICTDSFHRNNGPEHLVVIHDDSTRTVRMFVGLENDPLRICFEAVYTGTYAVANGPLAVGNLPSADRGLAGNYFQFAYYSRTLSFQVDGNRNVVSGELFENHNAGSAAELASQQQPDAGVADGASPDAEPQTDGASPDPDAAPPPDAAAADAGSSDDVGGVSTGCGCKAGPSRDETVPGAALAILFLFALFIRRRSLG